MQIRPARNTDMSSVEELFKLQELVIPSGEYLSAEILLTYLDDKFFLVAEENNDVVGALFGERLKNEGVMLWDFAVRDSLRGKGIGDLLLKAFENNIKLENRTWIIGYVPQGNPASIQFYKNRGYDLGERYIEFLKSVHK